MGVDEVLNIESLIGDSLHLRIKMIIPLSISIRTFEIHQKVERARVKELSDRSE